MAIQRINLGTAPSGTGGDTNRSAFKKIDDNFADSANAASRQIGLLPDQITPNKFLGAYNHSGADFVASTGLEYGFTGGANRPDYAVDGAVLNLSYNTDFTVQLFADWRTTKMSVRGKVNGVWGAWNTFWGTVNTTTDSNGFIKAASPIVKLFADKIELNDEAAQQKITFEKLGVGDYLVKGSTGFAQDGWYIEMPKDANGNVLVAVIYEQLANNDISVKTYAKMFDPDTGDIVPNTARPRDIPATRWIDIRLQALPQPDITPTDTVTTNA